MAVTTTQLNQLYLAYFGRPADFNGLNFYLNQPTATLDSVAAAFSASPESQALYGTSFGAAQVNAIYQNLFNRDAELAGLTYWSNEVNSGRLSAAKAAWGILVGAQNLDATSVANKLTINLAFTNALDTSAEVIGFAGTAAAASARAFIHTVTSDAATLTAATTGLDAAVLAAVTTGSANVGQTFTLTTGVDTPVGTSGNDTFIADNSSATTLSAADIINGGAGTDTLKVYHAAAGTTIGSATLSSIENLLVNGGVASALDISGTQYTGVTSLTVESPVLTAGALTTATYTVKQGQSVTLKGAAPTATSSTTVAQASSSTATSVNLTLDGWTSSSGIVSTVDLSGALVKTANIAATGNSSKITLANTGAGLNKLVITGDKALTLTESLNGVATIDASAHTATSTGVSVDVTGATIAAAFAFTGGSGNDSIKLADNALALLTAGSQIDGGAGTDKIGVMDADLTTAEYTALNAAKNVETLGVNAALTVDASKLTTIKSFALDGNAAQIISNLQTGSSVAINAAHAASINLSTATGVQDLALSIGTASSGGLAVGTVTTAATNVTLTSNGTNAAANSLTLANADNSTYTIKGSNDLSMGTLAGAAIGSKVDAAAFSGKLSVTGSAQSDILIGGSGNDTVNGGTITAGVAAVTAVKEAFSITFTGPAGGADTIAFNGTTITLADADATAAIATKVAAGTYTDWVAVATAGTGTVTFTAKVAGAVVDVTNAAFVITDVAAGAVPTKSATTLVTDGVTAVTGVTASLDILTGGAGVDTFVFSSANLDTAAAVVTVTITDFVTGVDKIKSTVVNAAGSATNYLEATTAAADLATLVAAADVALTGAVKYYVGQVGADSYVVIDSNGTGYTDVVKLTGVALTAIAATDFIA